MAEIARSYLADEIGPIETARRICDLGRFGKPQMPDRIFDDDPVLDEAFRVFVAVQSETDALPLGEVQKLWNPTALAAEKVKIASAEFLYRNLIAEACQKLVALLQTDERGLY